MYTQILFHISVLPALYQLHAGPFDGVRIRWYLLPVGHCKLQEAPEKYVTKTQDHTDMGEACVEKGFSLFHGAVASR
ncbi:hypothetical protein M405DRAFT_813225 [Rhizopogon salebrosus TDB-379]|nr:hypothetical protein M405DRAFT_813225 [Rhizopogon salebrosus TDB-379]